MRQAPRYSVSGIPRSWVVRHGRCRLASIRTVPLVRTGNELELNVKRSKRTVTNKLSVHLLSTFCQLIVDISGPFH